MPLSSVLLLCFLRRQLSRKFNFAMVNFHSDLRNSDILKSLLDEKDVNAAATVFTNFLVFLLNKHFPLRTVRLRSDDRPWVKPSLKYLINKRDRAFAEGMRLKYSRLRTGVIRHIAKLKSRFLSFAVNARSSSSMWRTI